MRCHSGSSRNPGSRTHTLVGFWSHSTFSLPLIWTYCRPSCENTPILHCAFCRSPAPQWKAGPNRATPRRGRLNLDLPCLFATAECSGQPQRHPLFVLFPFSIPAPTSRHTPCALTSQGHPSPWTSYKHAETQAHGVHTLAHTPFRSQSTSFPAGYMVPYPSRTAAAPSPPSLLLPPAR